MNKIVPFKKNLDFDTIYEINSISLEHTLSLKEENTITGKFLISGTYKMTEASINIDDFSYDLPFEISIDSKYDTKNVSVDINDFYYEIIDNKTLAVNIEVIIENLEEKEIQTLEQELEEVREASNEETLDYIEKNNEILENIEEKNEIFENEFKPLENIEKKSSSPREELTSIFDDMDCDENYVTYKVHIMTENDTIESLLQKYEISSTKLENYNNLSDLKIGDKIIIPTND